MRFTAISHVALVSLVGIGALGLLTMQPHAVRAQDTTRSAIAVLRSAAGDEVGRVSFTGGADGVTLWVHASGLTPGFHGLHVHANGQCDAPDFTSAGPHFNVPDMGQTMAMQSGHSGDLPSLLVNDDGTAELTTVTARFDIDDLLTGAGTAVIVHAGPDNFGNIPTRYAPAPDATTLATGDAGARVACGVVQPA
jgi:Cu-Zn family superoxide dismutase